jgi:Tfp pilus assembly protein PilN
MTADLARPTSAAKDVAHAQGLPQVNLLPPELRAARALGSMKRWLALGVVASLAVSGVMVTIATHSVNSAETSLATAQKRTGDLLAEQAKYAEVPAVLGALDSAKTARVYGMSGDVAWADYIGAITAVAPQQVSIDSLQVQIGPPQEALVPSANLLTVQGVGRLTLVGRTATVPDTAAWITSLDSVPGFDSAYFTSSPISEKNGSVYYKVTATVELQTSALSGRYFAKAGGDS